MRLLRYGVLGVLAGVALAVPMALAILIVELVRAVTGAPAVVPYALMYVLNVFAVLGLIISTAGIVLMLADVIKTIKSVKTEQKETSGDASHGK